MFRRSGHRFAVKNMRRQNPTLVRLAVRLLHDFAHALVTGSRPDLSGRQLTVLLTIYLESPPHTVRGLAAKLRVTKPVITRALDSMGKLGLVSRKRDLTDRR